MNTKQHLSAEHIRQTLTQALAKSEYDAATRESIVSYCAEIGVQLTPDWQNVSRNDAHAKKPHYNPELLRVAETLAHYGIAEVEYRPQRIETRRDWFTDEVKEVGLGCRCFVRGKF